MIRLALIREKFWQLLLDESVCFVDLDDSLDTSIRLSRVPQMIKQIAKILTGNEDLPGFLRNHFVGLLNSIDRKQVHATKRIEMLINMMGSHLSTYVPKVIKHVMSYVFAALIPLLEKQKEHSSFHMIKIVKILEEAVFENESVLTQLIYEFPPLPNIPALADVNKVIDEACGAMSLKDQLQDIVDGLNHENLNVGF